jgi:molybdate/tungstate transport system substrate-binding protein
MAKKFVALLCCIAFVVGMLGPGYGIWQGEVARTETLVIYHAGSLAVPFELLEEEFELTHPNVDVLCESGGSRERIQLAITHEKAGESPPDIIASADYTLLTEDSEYRTGGYANWCIAFARNGMVIAYTDSSAYANKITMDNWYQILQWDGVKYGHSNPDQDPCGYRTLMVCQLAEKHYEVDELYAALIGGTDEPLHAGRPEYAHPNEVVARKSVDLVSYLQSGDLDYAFEYRSVAVQHGLKFIELNEHINLSKTDNDIPGIEGFYEQAQVWLSGATNPKEGKAIVCGVTIPENAQHPELAMEFIALLLSEKGQEIMTDICGQPSISPAWCDAPENLPMPIIKYNL